jgi:PAS domain S-box-containing protein
LFDDSIDPIFITDLKGRILEPNRQASVLSGYTARQLHDLTIQSLHEIKLGTGELHLEKIKTGHTRRYESLLQNKAGHTSPIEVYLRRVVFEDTDCLQWTFRDISERRELDALRNDLMAMIYHDLRSPLANIVSSLDVLTTLFEGQEDETVKSVMNIAERSTDRIQRLINSLLDINRLESGQAIVSQKAVSPVNLVREAVETVQPMIESRHQTLKNSLPSKLPSIWVDADMIRRVLINLLENACKFTPPQGGIEVGAKIDGDWLLLWVSDNGPGIPLADQDIIFNMFTRLKREGMPGGLGVGLAFCRLAVTGHGGRIWVESETGKGARFLLTLPVHRPK